MTVFNPADPHGFNSMGQYLDRRYHQLASDVDTRPVPPPEAHACETGAPVSDGRELRLPTPFEWKDPASLPIRPWVYGHHLIRKQVSVTVAPGGVGKSTLTIAEAVAMASGKRLLGEWAAPGLKVWIYNLEDPADELQRRVTATMLHHSVAFGEIAGRLFIDTGRERPLCTAVQTRNGTEIMRPEIDALAEEIAARGIDVVIIDPFVSSHQVSENDNGAIDLVAKEWARLADRCNIAIELVHHTRKLNGEVGSSESGRGASALLSAARSGRVLNKMTPQEREDAGLVKDERTYFAVLRDKANLAPESKREWRRMASYHLPNGDSVGVAEVWEWPDEFDGIQTTHLLQVQRQIDELVRAGTPPRFSDQAANWAGAMVAEVLGLDVDEDKKRIRKIINTWIQNGALRKGSAVGPIRKPVPTVEVDEWVTE